MFDWWGRRNAGTDRMYVFMLSHLLLAPSDTVAVAATTPLLSCHPLCLPLRRPLSTLNNHQVVVFDIDETVLSNMDQILDPVAWPWDKWVAAAQAPALQPSLRFYRALCAGGYSVAFVTGRKESSRNSTMHNLETAGYGKPCKPGPGPFYGVMSSGSSSSSECCYSALYLRQQGDTQLASVYKPGARQDLLTKGNMTLMALVGDQFSDLNGEHSAPFAFKLPNPFYYIL